MKQLPKGKKYHLLQPVYSLNFVNDIFEPDLEGYYHYYNLVHYLHSEKVLDGLHIVFVELPKFKAKNLTERKMQVLWLRFLTEINEDTKRAPKALLDNPQVNEALEIVEESALNDEEMAAYNGFWDWMSREATNKVNMEMTLAKINAIEAERNAIEAERDAAVAERDAAAAERDAAVEKLRQTARNLKAMGLPAEQISAATGLSATDIASL